MRITNLFWTVVLLAPLSVFAQQQKENLFTIDAQIRTRGEYRNGVLNPRPEGEEPTFFVNERARLSLGYQRDRLQMRLSAQHVGVWGQDPQIDKNGRFICMKRGLALTSQKDYLRSWEGNRCRMMMSVCLADWTGMWPGDFTMH